MMEGYESAVIAAMVGLLTVIAGMFAGALELSTLEEVEKDEKRCRRKGL